MMAMPGTPCMPGCGTQKRRRRKGRRRSPPPSEGLAQAKEAAILPRLRIAPPIDRKWYKPAAGLPSLHLMGIPTILRPLY